MLSGEIFGLIGILRMLLMGIHTLQLIYRLQNGYSNGYGKHILQHNQKNRSEEQKKISKDAG